MSDVSSPENVYSHILDDIDNVNPVGLYGFSFVTPPQVATLTLKAPCSGINF